MPSDLPRDVHAARRAGVRCGAILVACIVGSGASTASAAAAAAAAAAGLFCQLLLPRETYLSDSCAEVHCNYYTQTSLTHTLSLLTLLIHTHPHPHTHIRTRTNTHTRIHTTSYLFILLLTDMGCALIKRQ